LGLQSKKARGPLCVIRSTRIRKKTLGTHISYEHISNTRT
jgi:hypothetical protein